MRTGLAGWWDCLLTFPGICPAVRRLHGVEESRSDLGPADKEEWSDGVEGRFAVVAGDKGFGDVEGEGDGAREDEQSPRRAQDLYRPAVHGESPAAEKQTDDRQVHRRRDEWCDPDWNTESQAECEDVPVE